jgi:hypothetical protein
VVSVLLFSRATSAPTTGAPDESRTVTATDPRSWALRTSPATAVIHIAAKKSLIRYSSPKQVFRLVTEVGAEGQNSCRMTALLTPAIAMSRIAFPFHLIPPIVSPI